MWQVSGRSDITDFEEVVRLDKEYITNWNIGLDIKDMILRYGREFLIILKLFLKVFIIVNWTKVWKILIRYSDLKRNIIIQKSMLKN